MSPTAPRGNVGEHEWFQSGVRVGCGTVRFGHSQKKCDENILPKQGGSFSKKHNKSRKMREGDDIAPKWRKSWR